MRRQDLALHLLNAKIAGIIKYGLIFTRSPAKTLLIRPELQVKATINGTLKIMRFPRSTANRNGELTITMINNKHVFMIGILKTKIAAMKYANEMEITEIKIKIFAESMQT
jgi:hypothetical protein